MSRSATGQKLDRLNEGGLSHAHGKIDGTAATGSGWT
jgi:hypothetical protein